MHLLASDLTAMGISHSEDCAMVGEYVQAQGQGSVVLGMGRVGVQGTDGAGSEGQGRVNRQGGDGFDADHLSSPETPQTNRLTVTVPLRTGPGMNIREHHYERSRRVKRERIATAWALASLCGPHPASKPALPLTVHLTRCGPSRGLDDDNLQGSLKGVRDAVASWLGYDDRTEGLAFTYSQARTKDWHVAIEMHTGVVYVYD